MKSICISFLVLGLVLSKSSHKASATTTPAPSTANTTAAPPPTTTTPTTTRAPTPEPTPVPTMPSKHACTKTSDGEVCATATLSSSEKGGVTVSGASLKTFLGVEQLNGGELTVFDGVTSNCTKALAGSFCFEAKFQRGDQTLSLGCSGTLNVTLDYILGSWEVLKFDFCPPATPAPPTPVPMPSNQSCVKTKDGDVCATVSLTSYDEGGVTVSGASLKGWPLTGGDLTGWKSTICSVDIFAGIGCFKAEFPGFLVYRDQTLPHGCSGTLNFTVESNYTITVNEQVLEFDFCPPVSPTPPTPIPPPTPQPIGTEYCVNATVGGYNGSFCTYVSVANETTGGIFVAGGQFEGEMMNNRSFSNETNTTNTTIILAGGDLTFSNQKSPPCTITNQGIFCFHMNYSAAPQIVQTLEDGCAGAVTVSLEKDFKIVQRWTVANFVNFCPLPTPAPPTPKQTSPPWAKPDSQTKTGASLGTILTVAAFSLVGIFALLFFGYACLNKKRSGYDDGNPGETIGLNNPSDSAAGATKTATAV